MVDGGAADFASFYASVAPSLRRLAYARTGSWAAAEDLVQDAMADAHRRWADVGELDNPAAWVRRAVLNRSISRLRRRGREHRALQRVVDERSGPGPEAPALADEELWKAIRSLSSRQTAIVLLLWFEDLPVAEVARTLGCGEETVRTHWRRARAKLADRLGERDGETASRRSGDGARASEIDRDRPGRTGPTTREDGR